MFNSIFKRNYTVQAQAAIKINFSKSFIKPKVVFFTNFLYYFKNLIHKKKYLSFFIFSSNNYIYNFYRFIRSIFLIKCRVYTISNPINMDQIGLYNWKFNSFLTFFYENNSYLNFSLNLASHFKLLNFFNLYKSTVYFIIDCVFNKKAVFFLKKIKKITLGSPINKFYYLLLSWPLITNYLVFSYNHIILIDLLFYKYLILFKKLS